MAKTKKIKKKRKNKTVKKKNSKYKFIVRVEF